MRSGVPGTHSRTIGKNQDTNDVLILGHFWAVRYSCYTGNTETNTAINTTINHWFTLGHLCVLHYRINKSRRRKVLRQSVCGSRSVGDRWHLSQLQRPQTRLPRRHCSHALFWWAEAPKGDRVTTHSSSSRGSAKSPPLSRFLPLTRLSNSSTKSNKHALCYVHKHSSVLTDIMSCASSSFGAIPDGHPGLHGRFLSVKRLLTDVAVRAGSGELARSGWGSWPTPGESTVTAESELTDDIWLKKTLFKRSGSVFTHMQVPLSNWPSERRSASSGYLKWMSDNVLLWSRRGFYALPSMDTTKGHSAHRARIHIQEGGSSWFINNKSEFFDIFFVILFYFEGVVHLFFLLPFFCSHSAVQLFPPFLYSNKGLYSSRLCGVIFITSPHTGQAKINVPLRTIKYILSHLNLIYSRFLVQLCPPVLKYINTTTIRKAGVFV